MIRQAELLHRLGRPADAERAARQAADLFAGLAAEPPTARHSHDPVFHGQALLVVAQAMRASPAVAAAREVEDQAVQVLRAAATADAHPDLWHNLHRCVIHRAANRLDAGEPSGAAAAELDAAVAGLRGLVDCDPAVAHWQRDLALGLALRGRSRGAGDPAAADDLEAAVRLLTRLHEAGPDRPDYRGALADALAGQARRHPPGDRRATLYQQAALLAEQAAALAPDDALLARTAQRVATEAAVAGADSRR